MTGQSWWFHEAKFEPSLHLRLSIRTMSSRKIYSNHVPRWCSNHVFFEPCRTTRLNLPKGQYFDFFGKTVLLTEQLSSKWHSKLSPNSTKPLNLTLKSFSKHFWIDWVLSPIWYILARHRFREMKKRTWLEFSPIFLLFWTRHASNASEWVSERPPFWRFGQAR